MIDSSPSGLTLAAISSIREGLPVTKNEFDSILSGYANQLIPDYQLSALLATIASAGLSAEGTSALTEAYVESGQRLEIRSMTELRVADMHSVGGVGDKVSMIVTPIVAACGLAVAKITGRGLGIAGGTVDKLESIPGIQAVLEAKAATQVLAKTGIFMTGQSKDFVPADELTYTLRDVTATVDSVPLISASIMSKKIAVGAHGIVLQVTYGRSSAVPNLDAARDLAHSMLEVAASSGLYASAVLCEMDTPLGRMVGNSLEVVEAVEVLGGRNVPGLSELVHRVAVEMILSSDPTSTEESASESVRLAISSGDALRKFDEWIHAQHGPIGLSENLGVLPKSGLVVDIKTPTGGFLADVDAAIVGEVALELGAGRKVVDSIIDHRSGIELTYGVGERVEPGVFVARVHCEPQTFTPELEQALLGAFHFSNEPIVARPRISEVVRSR